MSKKLGTTLGVVNSVAPKSLVVVVSRKVKNRLGRYVSCTTKMHVHDEDCLAKSGDQVLIVPCKPFSKQKTWRLHEVISDKSADKGE
jgi:small subunit ribosomal protein S17